MSDDKNKKNQVTTKDAEATGITIQLNVASEGNLPAVQTVTGGLTYASADADEKAQMETIIASIDLTDSDAKSLLALGSEERQKLADLADKLLDSLQPSVKIAFAEALRALTDAVKSNSLTEIKNRITDGTLKNVFKAMVHAVTFKSHREAVTKQTIERFMTDITGTRKTIEDMIDKLQDQVVELDKNYVRINELGYQMTSSAQAMRVVRAATAEYIRRVEAGEITVLSDLEAQANTTKNAKDYENLQVAQNNWNLLRTIDGDLLASTGVYDMNVANLAFTKQANIQNRIQTKQTLTTSVSEWKSQLALFGLVTTEKFAADLIQSGRDLTAKSVQANKDLFDSLVDITVQNAARGTYSLRQIIETQGAMASKLESIGPQIDEQFRKLEEDKKALEISSAKFRESAAKVYSTNSGATLGSLPGPKGPSL
jgi:hypothetical protein